ncbi:hypothetical protein Tco_1539834 [Tanacetum coccineum]
MLGAAGVQIPENNLDDLHSSREEDGYQKTRILDIRILLLLADIDLIIFSSVSRVVVSYGALQQVVGCDPLALVDGFTPVEDNIGLLETRVTSTNFSLELLMLG